MKIFDTHAHLASKELAGDFQNVILRAKKQNVFGLCLISTNQDTVLDCEQLYLNALKTQPEMRLAWSAGLHPHDAKLFTPELADFLTQKAQSAHAIGETGLDYHYKLSSQEKQHESFRFHIQLAKKLNKPLIIHCRESIGDILRILDEENIKEHPQPGILHCFTESTNSALSLLEKGFFISFSGILTFKNATALRETARVIPIEKLLVETDAPYLTPVPFRGKINEPSYITSTLEVLAQTRSIEVKQLAKQLWDNSCKLFFERN